MQRLYKSNDRKIAGVCGGLSHYINPELDPIIVRTIFLVVCLFNPFLAIAYLVLALILPDNPVRVVD
ncbi:PspC domain-containing protein [Ancylomarina salipaludis]|uniref:PspC domain-containing protein n=1 Tax=Ancylomarina salipaludis TaxID=2501299 RepID=A0A4Q1JIY3_9BACT|nr:PspC domain-containing protein [Ancylomarina salipaludis]RXQ89052.1 PspC domain-containing protein [Ancylomarina salipaludis]